MNTILVYTNCQGQGLIKLLAQHGAFGGTQFVHLKAWLQEDPTAQQLEDCQILIYHTAWGMPAFLPQLPSSTKKIAIPLLSCSLFWPFAFDKPDEPAGWRFPYGDRNLIKKMKQGMAPDQAVDAYLDEDLAVTIRLDKLFQLEQHKWRHNDTQTQIQLCDFITEHIFQQRLFFTPDHPTDFLLIELANQILGLLNMAQFNRPDWRTHTHALHGVELPIHTSILRHFAIPFLSETHHYPLVGGWLSMTGPDYLKKYAAALTHPTFSDGVDEATAALVAGDFATALNITTLIRDRELHHRDAMTVQAVASALLGNKLQATALLQQIIHRVGGAT